MTMKVTQYYRAAPRDRKHNNSYQRFIVTIAMPTLPFPMYNHVYQFLPMFFNSAAPQTTAHHNFFSLFVVSPVIYAAF